MQIKVFKAGNMKDAMASMKAELGEDAVILHSKKYKEGGILGIGSREVVEITAAVEESALPKKIESSKRVAPSSVVNRYKTDGTAQGVETAEKISSEGSKESQQTSTEPLTEIPPHSMQTDALTEKVSAQKSFENILQETQEDSSETIPAYNQPIEEKTAPVAEVQPIEEKHAPVAEIQPVEEKPAPVAEIQPVEEKPALVDKVQPVEEKPAPVDKVQPVEEKPAPADKVQPVEEKPAPADEVQPVEEKSAQQGTVFTQEQMAQTQAMIMAQFNQMQMMQQAAIAQAQAQAAEQIRLQQAAQAQQAALSQPSTDPHSEEKIKKLEEEIAQMKILLAEVLVREPKNGAISLHEALKRQEVEEDILKEMATQSNAGETLVDINAPSAKPTLKNYLNEHVKFSDGVKLNRHGVRIVALLGTTGVGKTTTLAKIAAKFVLEQRSNVALITADTYRISAVEQLKTYSDILELPLEIVYNPQELASAIERHRNKELILIDTAGRSQHNEYQMRELEEFLRVNPRIEKHLVISATTKYTDARQIMSKFSQVLPDRIIFTKIDETGSLGMIVNLLHDSKYSLSYITTGQSVPDDIERANSDILTNLLLEKVVEEY